MTTYQLTHEGYVIKDGDTKVPTAKVPDIEVHPETLAYEAWLEAGGVPLPAELPPIAERRAAVWERIKAERDRRAALGVKVGAHWFHSDQKSRTQQLGLVLLGQSIPAELKWKTLTFTPPPVFVTMTPALAVGIVQSTAASDTAIFTVAEVHRMTMEVSTAPQDYDFSTGWPVSIEEEANEAGIQFDASVL
ncbi:DUF4376 domain-containing protein [Acidovorax facilis]|uniref:DUF4376 domain-containing protein n=1 Tax=Acidovorax facilis TaxID=12917 RepID=UPI003CEBE0FD